MRFKQEVAAASPSSRFISPVWFEPIIVPSLSPDAPAAVAQAQKRQVVNPPGLAPLVPAYSVAIRNGDRLFVSGMTGVKPGSQDIVEGGVSAQTRQTLENIQSALRASGATMADVDECTVFLMDMKDYAAMNAVCARSSSARSTACSSSRARARPRPA